MSYQIDKITIEGFKSIRKLENFDLRSLNVLIGANGAGKSNFVDFFRFLHDLVQRRLQLAVATGGGADAYLHRGPKVTTQIAAEISLGALSYRFALVPTEDGRSLIFADEAIGGARFDGWISLGSGHAESKVKDSDFGTWGALDNASLGWNPYHFHDTSTTAGVRRLVAINDNEYLRPDGSNLAAILYLMHIQFHEDYARIRDAVRLAAPFFDDFKLRPIPANPEKIQLEWLQKHSDYPFRASQLSDGTLRFACLATALLQPRFKHVWVGITIVFDEPELGLHPYALTLLANLLQQAAQSQQVIVSTHAAALLNEFGPEDVIVVDRVRGESIFQRLDSAHLSEWLQEYTLGELWQKNVLGGRPHSEEILPPFDGNSDSIVTAHHDRSGSGGASS